MNSYLHKLVLCICESTKIGLRLSIFFVIMKILKMSYQSFNLTILISCRDEEDANFGIFCLPFRTVLVLVLKPIMKVK